MNIKYISRYAYKVFRLIFIALMLTYFLGSFWYFLVSTFKDDINQKDFHTEYELDKLPEFDRMILCCYFILTTLSTVGYGDLSP